MTLKESYQSAYARKNQAIRANLQSKKTTLGAKKKRLDEENAEKLRAAYTEYMRSAAVAEQGDRAAGRVGGAAENQSAGRRVTHQQKNEALRADHAAEIAAVDEQIASAAATAQKQIEDNEIALKQKLDNLALKEQEAAQKAAQKAAKATTKSTAKKSSSSNGKVSKSQAISLMKMGIYDASFASILGISDSEVRAYVAGVEQDKTPADTRLPGTYKPPLK